MQDPAAPSFDINDHGALCGPFIMKYMWKVEIYIFYHTASASDHMDATENLFQDFEAILGINLQDSAAPTLEINGHGASDLVTCEMMKSA